MDGVKRRRSMETAALHHWAHRLTEQVLIVVGRVYIV